MEIRNSLFLRTVDVNYSKSKRHYRNRQGNAGACSAELIHEHYTMGHGELENIQISARRQNET